MKAVSSHSELYHNLKEVTLNFVATEVIDLYRLIYVAGNLVLTTELKT